MTKKTRVLIIDDSAMAREILARGLAADPEIEVIGTASNPYIARDKILELHPDVLTLDVEMPRMDGVEFLQKLMPQYPLPVLMVSSLTRRGAEITIKALEAGAIDFVAKPGIDVARGLNEMLGELRAKVKMAARAKVRHWKRNDYRPITADLNSSGAALMQTTDKVIAIGASTGGTEAIRHILKQLPADLPGMVIVQHMPPGFTSLFAKGLDEQCALSVKEAADGDRVMPGHVLIAPGDFHITVRRSGGMYVVNCTQGEKVSGHRPSADVLFQSAAKSAGPNAIGVILTGMGGDGADGLLAMRQAGARTLAQDEASSVVFGMPKVAHERGAVECLVPLQRIPQKVMSLLAETRA